MPPSGSKPAAAAAAAPNGTGVGSGKKTPVGMLDEGQRWLDLEPPLGKRPAPAQLPTDCKPKQRPGAAEVDAFRLKGDVALSDAAEKYDAWRLARADGDDKFMDQMLRSGTLADRVAAMTLRVQQSPVHGLSVVDSLLKLCGKGNHRGARLALEALVDLFKSQLLPDDRHLLPLEHRPLLSDQVKDMHVLAWSFEAALKTRFAQLLDHLTTALQDNTADFRKFGLDCAADLLEAKPEQEAALLTMCVNKLGDPDRKVASRASYRLQLLLRHHGAMAATVVRFTQALLVRPHLSPRGLYNGIVFLNQIYLTGNDDKSSGKNGKNGKSATTTSSSGGSAGAGTSGSLAESLMATYLGLFQRAVDGGELKSRLLAALLTGVARAQPYLPPSAWKGTSSSSSSSSADASAGKSTSSNGGGVLGEHIDTIFKIVHTGSFQASTQALSILLFFVTQQQQREARKSLSSSGGGSVGGKGAGKGGKGGKGKGGKGSGASTSADGASSSAAAGEGSTTAPLVDRFYRALYAALGAGHLAATSKPTLFLNLIFKAMSADRDNERVCAFAKRLLQQTLHAPGAPHAAAALFLLSHVAQASAGVRQLLHKVRGALPSKDETGAAASAIENDDDDDKDDDNSDEEEEEKDEKAGKATTNMMTSAVVVNHDDGKDDEGDDDDEDDNSKEGASSSSGVTYDPSAREPKGAGASESALWELTLLSRHFHPSVQAFAQSLVDPTSGHSITYAGDPLVDFALMPFLDKIVFKQAKASGAVRPGAARMGGSKHSQATAAAASSQGGDKNGNGGGGGLRGLSVQSTEFLELDASAVPPDHQFFHRFFVAKEALNQRRLGKGGNSSSMIPGAGAGAAAGARTPFGLQEESDDEEGGLLGEKGSSKKKKKSAGNGNKDSDDDDDDDDGVDDDDIDDEDDDDDEGDGEAYEQGLSLKEAQALLDDDETDDEERAFADGLAEKMMDDHAKKKQKNLKGQQHQRRQVAVDDPGDVDEIPDWARDDPTPGGSGGSDSGDEDAESSSGEDEKAPKRGQKVTRGSMRDADSDDDDDEDDDDGEGDEAAMLFADEDDDDEDDDDEEGFSDEEGSEDAFSGLHSAYAEGSEEDEEDESEGGESGDGGEEDDDDDDDVDDEEEEEDTLEAALSSSTSRRKSKAKATSKKQKAPKAGSDEDDDDDDDDNAMFKVDFSDSDDDNNAAGKKALSNRQARKSKAGASPFASADDFGDVINGNSDDDDDDDGIGGSSSKKAKKKRAAVEWEQTGSTRAKRRKESGSGSKAGKGKAGKGGRRK